MKLTENFTLEELTHSTTAEAQGIDNTPTLQIIENLGKLSREVLQPLRNHLAKSIRISSGYRCDTLNKVIGGSATSDHVKGLAADITVDGMTVDQVFNAIKIQHSFSYGQCILEKVKGKNWVHISWGTKRENLTAKDVNGKVIYEKA